MNPQDQYTGAPNNASAPEAFNQPVQPTNNPYQAPIAQQMPASPAPQAYNQPPQATQVVSSSYESNPFYSMLNALSSIIKFNRKSGLLGSLILITFFWIAYVAYFVFLITAAAMATTNPNASGDIVMTFIVLIISALFGLVLSGMVYAIASASANEREISTATALGSAFKKLPKFFVLSVISSLMIGIGFLLLIVPGLYLLGRLSLSGMVMFAEDLGPIASVKRSMTLTKGRVMEMLGALMGGGLLSGSSFGLLSLPLGALPFMSRYQDFKKLEASGAPKPSTHWLNYALVLTLPIIIGLFILLIMVTPRDSSFGTEGTGLQSQDQTLDGLGTEFEGDFEIQPQTDDGGSLGEQDFTFPSEQ